MKIHRFYADGDLATGALTIADPQFHNQVRNVLKLAVGEPVILFNSTGVEAVGNIATIGKTDITIEISELRKSTAEPTRSIRLYLSILKNEHFELAAQKAVECGVTEIIPVITSRTIKLSLKPERVMKIMREAAEQCGRVSIPRLSEIVPLAQALAQAKHNNVNLFCDSSGGEFSSAVGKHNQIGIWIGPEGGFSSEEISVAKAAGCVPVSLGNLVLRAETAAIIATYLAVHS